MDQSLAQRDVALRQRPLLPGMSREQLAELGGHRYAAVRITREAQPVLLSRQAPAGCDVTYYVRTESEDAALKEAMPEDSLVGTYLDGCLRPRVHQ